MKRIQRYNGGVESSSVAMVEEPPPSVMIGLAQEYNSDRGTVPRIVLSVSVPNCFCGTCWRDDDINRANFNLMNRLRLVITWCPAR